MTIAEEEEKLKASLEHDQHINAKFTPDMVELLKEKAMKLKNVPGFGTATLGVMAADLYARSIGNDAGVLWWPSPAWVYNFLKNTMHLKLRRVTGSRPKIENLELTDKLHDINLGHLALLIKKKNLQPWMCAMSDEFALLAFMTSSYMWEEKGVAHVYGMTGEDKRQITANTCLMGDGSVLGNHMIFTGKSAKVHPKAASLDPDFKDVLFDHTSNHWCDLESKKRFVSFLWDRYVEKWAVKQGVSVDVARDEAWGVFFLDCWVRDARARSARCSRPSPR